MSVIRVETGIPYEVHVDAGILGTIGDVVRENIPSAQTVAVVTDTNVGGFYLQRVTDSLQAAGLHVVSRVIPAGEQSKNLDEYAQVLSFLAQENVTRSDAIIALGGGVVGDLAGFASATYLRGIDYIQVPTSLLAMVDSSVGGKTAVDLPEGKNLVGAFYQPKAVLCDVETLNTLPEEDFRNGCAEVIKYGVLSSPELFAHLAQEGTGFDRVRVIEECVRIKAEIVAEDERDTGLRRMLNLGHTFGHAVEAKSNYELTHGTAVAIGMALIARAASVRGHMSANDAQGVCACIGRFGLPVNTQESARGLMPYVASDKKRQGDQVHLIVPTAIGHCEIIPVPVDECEQWITEGIAG